MHVYFTSPLSMETFFSKFVLNGIFIREFLIFISVYLLTCVLFICVNNCYVVKVKLLVYLLVVCVIIKRCVVSIYYISVYNYKYSEWPYLGI